MELVWLGVQYEVLRVLVLGELVEWQVFDTWVAVVGQVFEVWFGQTTETL